MTNSNPTVNSPGGNSANESMFNSLGPMLNMAYLHGGALTSELVDQSTAAVQYSLQQTAEALKPVAFILDMEVVEPNEVARASNKSVELDELMVASKKVRRQKVRDAALVARHNDNFQNLKERLRESGAKTHAGVKQNLDSAVKKEVADIWYKQRIASRALRNSFKKMSLIQRSLLSMESSG